MRSRESTVTFHAMLDNLRLCVSDRIASGETTERALAIRAGISQSHLHNVLKGVRSMTPEIADRLIATLRLTLDEIAVAKPNPYAGRTPHHRA